MNYGDTPKELKEILNLFEKNKLKYNLFKCEHIFAGQNKNLDILFASNDGYRKAACILEQQGFYCYLPESVEKYKKMYIKFDKQKVTAIHLHREISWHGLPVLDKRKVFERAEGFVPSPEDSLLIHVAHALFENFSVNKYQRELIMRYKNEVKDRGYIKAHLSKQGWKNPFFKFIKNPSISRSLILEAYILRLTKNPLYIFNLFSKTFGAVKRRLSFKRKGLLVSLVGVNGAGKTTTTNELLKAYSSLADFMNGKKAYYFGWNPFLPTTKMFSKISKKRSKRELLKMKSSKTKLSETKTKIKRSSGLSGLLKSLYVYIEYQARYWLEIYPELRKGKVVFTDRYYYDQYEMEKNKIKKLKRLFSWFLLKTYPKTDLLFVLDAPLDIITKRDKNIDVAADNIERKKERMIHSDEDLLYQKEKYRLIQKIFGAELIETTGDKKKKIQYMVDMTWKKHKKKLSMNL